jgi:ATP-dependent exoDNAse (exonuclease V) alpha subunit
MACHKAQGVSVDTALLYGTAALSREAGYVALSRGRTTNHVYVPDVSDDNRTTRVVDQSHLDLLAARLAVRHTQTLAVRQLPRYRDNGWLRSRSHDINHGRVEGISR